MFSYSCFYQENNYEGISNDILRKCISIAECVISLHKKQFTPFSVGLALQFHHEYGSKQLIETLNYYGFCANYTEVRRFLTSAANHEISKSQSGLFIPNDICLKISGGGFIQEGSDNVDLNTETIDGKNTFHSMARAVFQVISNQPADLIKIKRGQEKCLPINEDTTAMMACLPFKKPKERFGPLRYDDPYSNISVYSNTKNEVTYMIWVLLRSLTRPMVEVPLKTNVMEQVVPFWTGFNKILSDRQPDHVVVAYPPIIDAKPADMATVYTTMCKCTEMSTAVGQGCSVQTFDQQLYAIAQLVKWSMPEKFESHVLRLGGFHTLSCFMSALGKIWATAGLRDLLVDSGVYDGCTGSNTAR